MLESRCQSSIVNLGKKDVAAPLHAPSGSTTSLGASTRGPCRVCKIIFTNELRSNVVAALLGRDFGVCEAKVALAEGSWPWICRNALQPLGAAPLRQVVTGPLPSTSFDSRDSACQAARPQLSLHKAGISDMDFFIRSGPTLLPSEVGVSIQRTALQKIANECNNAFVPRWNHVCFVNRARSGVTQVPWPRCNVLSGFPNLLQMLLFVLLLLLLLLLLLRPDWWHHASYEDE